MCICFAHTNKFSKTRVEDFQRMMLGLVDRRHKKQVMDHERTVFRSPRCLIGPKKLSDQGVPEIAQVPRRTRLKAMDKFLRMDREDIDGDDDNERGCREPWLPVEPRDSLREACRSEHRARPAVTVGDTERSKGSASALKASAVPPRVTKATPSAAELCGTTVVLRAAGVAGVVGSSIILTWSDLI